MGQAGVDTGTFGLWPLAIGILLTRVSAEPRTEDEMPILNRDEYFELCASEIRDEAPKEVERYHKIFEKRRTLVLSRYIVSTYH